MKPQTLDDAYWSSRYQQKQTGWDIGGASGPLTHYIDQLSNKDLRILIPGCGNAYEAAYLLEKGFRNITLIDISKTLVEDLQKKFGEQRIRILHGDFFEHTGQYDLVLEQTFFCAIDPQHRSHYATKMNSLLAPGGKLAGVLFNRTFEGGPPFGGNVAEYTSHFENLFEIKIMEPCYNSILPRKNAEAFIRLAKK